MVRKTLASPIHTTMHLSKLCLSSTYNHIKDQCFYYELSRTINANQFVYILLAIQIAFSLVGCRRQMVYNFH